MEARDYLGQPIQLGDEVVYVRLGYRSFHRAWVKRITPKMVQLITRKDSAYTIKQSHKQVIVIKEIDEANSH